MTHLNHKTLTFNQFKIIMMKLILTSEFLRSKILILNLNLRISNVSIEKF